MKRHGKRLSRETRITQFWENFIPIPECGCWIWEGDIKNYTFRYATFKLNGKSYAIHRLAWELTNGTIPKDISVLHKCDTPLCGNPRHLFLGTQQDNVYDQLKKNRIVKGENVGTAKLTEQQVIEIRKSTEHAIVLAQMYNVNRTAIIRIRQRKLWKHIK